MRIRPSAFDSEIFGVRVGKTVVDGLDRPTADELRQELLASDLDAVFIRDGGFRFERASELPWTHLELADVKLRLGRATGAPLDGVNAAFAVVEEVSPADGPALTAMAHSIARLSRFHRCFGEAAAFRLYEAWLRNALAKRAADWCFLARHAASGEAAGLMAVTRDGAAADLALVATADGYRGRGVLRLMAGTALRVLRAEGVATCTVATQISNRAALAAYQALGFAVEGTVVDFHMNRGQ
jgi:ribosomal protein S18 acetylase RimI-like enzyme